MPARAAGASDDTARVELRVVNPAAPMGSLSRVILTGAANPNRPRSTAIPASGRVAISGLAPDVYEITVEVPGFAAGRIEVRVTAREIVRLDVVLAPSGKGISRVNIADRFRDGEGVTFDRAWLDDLPGGDDVWRLFETAAPFTIADRMDNGGLYTGRSALVGSRAASWTSTAVSFDGAAIGPPGSTGRLPVAIDPQVLAAAALTSGLAPVEIGTPGAAVSLVPRRPGSEPGGVVYAYGTSANMVSDNATDAPSVELLSSWWNVGGEFAGPIRETAGVLAAASIARARFVELGQPGEQSGDLASLFGHVVMNRAGRDQVRILAAVQGVSHPFDERRQFADRQVQTSGAFWQTQATWERMPERGGRYRFYGGLQGWAFTPQIKNAAGGLVDRATDGVVPSPASSTNAVLFQLGGEFEWPAWVSGASVHAVRAGATLRYMSDSSEVLALPVVAESVGGEAARVWMPIAPDVSSQRSLTDVALYVADRIGIGSGLTIDAGVRLDAASGQAQGAATGISWTSVSPRASFRWQSASLGVFGGAGRYASPATLSLLAFGDPGEAVFNVHRWIDLNGDARVDPAETGVLVARSGRGASVAAIDPQLKGPHTTEWTIGAEYRRGSFMTLRGALVWRRESSLVGSLNTGVPESSYRVYFVPDQGADWDSPDDDRPLAIYERLPSSFGRDAFLLTNPDGAEVTYEGIEVTWEVNGPRWRMLLGATTYRSHGLGAYVGHGVLENDPGIAGERYELPGAAAMPPGRLFFDRAYVGKWSGSYRAPGDVLLSATVRYQDGQPFSRLVVASGLAGGPELVEAYEMGLTRFTYTGTVDVRVEKGFPIGERRGVFRLDVFNLLNASNEVDEDVLTGPTFRRSTALQPPLTLRVGLKLIF